MFITFNCVLWNFQNLELFFIIKDEVFSFYFFSFRTHSPFLWRYSYYIFNEVQIILLISMHSVLNSNISNIKNDIIIESFDIVNWFNVILITNKCLTDIINICLCQYIHKVHNWVTRLAILNFKMSINLKLSKSICIINCFQNIRSLFIYFITKNCSFGSLFNES